MNNNCEIKYFWPIPKELCNTMSYSGTHFVIDARLTAKIYNYGHNLEIKFSIEEDVSYIVRNSLKKQVSDRVWATVGESSFGEYDLRSPFNFSDSKSGNISTIIGLIYNSAPSDRVCSILNNMFYELEVVKKFQECESWIKDAMPKWFAYLIYQEEVRRNSIVAEVHDS